MMNLKYQLSKGFAFGVLMLGLIMLQQTGAELATAQGAPINNLYDNLLQREYAGPIVFPNHQVERKAQRSPSLRLRFGRSDPEMLNNIVEKRWFGDVNQKPIRSPSLRLRFGRRSDPNLPQMRRTAYDDLLERELTLNQQQMNQPSVGEETELSDDYDVAFERVVRKPQRLRWGRSLVRLIASGDDKDQQQRARLEQQLQMMEQFARNLREYIQRAETSEKFPIDEYLRDLRAVSTENSEEEQDEDNSDSINQFQRESRKPMRLRWGRSTGKAPADQKIPLPAETASVAPKAQN